MQNAGLTERFAHDAAPDPVLIAQADFAMRNWQGPHLSGPVPLGSAMHKDMFCRVLLETHNPYKPAIIDWPKLNDEERARLANLPIWNLAVQTEGHAGIRVKTYGMTIVDRQLHEAIMMNGAEESRHKEVLHHMVAAYGIALADEPSYPAPTDPEWGFMITGFSECIDSFFAFGLFDLAKRSGYFPPTLVDTFEPVIQEECRHILFFANWFAWKRRNLPWVSKPGFYLKVLGIFGTIAKQRMATARDVSKGKNGKDSFTVTGHKSMGINAGLIDLLAICVHEDKRRFAGYDTRLVRPRFVPVMATLGLAVASLFGMHPKSELT